MITPKFRARYSHRLESWACWQTPEDWTHRTVGFGRSWWQAMADFVEQRRACGRYV